MFLGRLPFQVGNVHQLGHELCCFYEFSSLKVNPIPCLALLNICIAKLEFQRKQNRKLGITGATESEILPKIPIRYKALKRSI